jgi:hypothetical protein
MGKIVYINEQQLKHLLGYLINEEQHYPRVLEPLRDYIINLIDKKRKNEGNKFYFIINDQEFKNEYFAELKIEVTKSNTFYTKPKTNKPIATYYNTTGKIGDDKKLHDSIIEIEIPFETKDLYNDIKHYLYHELTHLYDDWNRLMKGKVSISYHTRNVVKNNFIDVMKNNDMVPEEYGLVSNLLYLSQKSERSAFVSQTYNELEMLGCTDKNYKEILRDCIGYKNYMTITNKIIPAIKEMEPYLLMGLAAWFNKVGDFPKFDKRPQSIGPYKQELIKYAERIRDRFLQKFYSIVSLYVNDYIKKYRNTKM